MMHLLPAKIATIKTADITAHATIHERHLLQDVGLLLSLVTYNFSPLKKIIIKIKKQTLITQTLKINNEIENTYIITLHV